MACFASASRVYYIPEFMKQLFLIWTMGISISSACAQFHDKLQGKPYDTEANNVTEGSPLFPEGWYKGVITLKSGEILDGIPIRYDKVNDRLLYEEEGQFYTAGPEVIQFH